MTFIFVWKSVCHFLLVVNSNLDPVSHRLATITRNGSQGHLRSMISMSTKRVYATCIFDWSYFFDTRLIRPICLTGFPYDLPFGHNKSVTDDNRRTNRRHDVPQTPYSIALARQKLRCDWNCNLFIHPMTRLKSHAVESSLLILAVLQWRHKMIVRCRSAKTWHSNVGLLTSFWRRMIYCTLSLL